jgi:hypothetical protein
LAAEGLAYLHEHARVPLIWTNHGDLGDIQNVGGDHPVYQQGDDPGSDTYLLDLLLHYGVKYFWNDYGSRNEFVLENPREAGRILQRESTRSGQKIACFLRHRGPLPKAPDAETLWKQITPEHLDALIAAQGKTIVYQHWCLHRDAEGRPFCARRPVFPSDSMKALAHLASLRDQGHIEVLRLTELLEALQPQTTS